MRGAKLARRALQVGGESLGRALRERERAVELLGLVRKRTVELLDSGVGRGCRCFILPFRLRLEGDLAVESHRCTHQPCNAAKINIVRW